jgi:site-specific DNA recombinase
MFLKLHIRLHSATEVLENTPSGKLMQHILAAFSEFDNDMRSERSAGGMKARLDEGGWVHKAPIGYRNIKDTLGRPTIEPDEMAPNVQRFLKDFAKGMYTKRNAAELAATKYGIKAKSYILVNGKRKYGRHYDKPVGQSTVYSMLRNPLYAGFVTGKNIDEPIAGLHRHHAFVTKEEYDAIQIIRTGTNQPILRPYGINKDRWPLRRYLRCGYCNSYITGSPSRGRNGVYEYYHCTKCKGVKTKDGRYKHLTLPRESIHDAYLKLMESVQPSVGALKLFKEVVIRKWNIDYAETIQRRTKVEQDIAALDKKKSGYIDMCRRGVISDDELQEERDKIAIERTRLEIELSDITHEFVNADRVLDMAIDFMANASRMWSIAEADDRVRFQHMALPEGLTVKEKQKFGTIKVGLPFKQAHLLEAQLEASKKTHQNDESLLVTSRRIELRLPG